MRQVEREYGGSGKTSVCGLLVELVDETRGIDRYLDEFEIEFNNRNNPF
jgi:hypothetical protein